MMAQSCKGGVIWAPKLRPVPPGITFSLDSTTLENNAAADLAVNNFWGSGRWDYFDTRVFDPTCATYEKKRPDQRFAMHAAEKKRKYEERVSRIDGGTFTPLVCTVFGGLSRDVKETIARAVAIRAEARGPGWEDKIAREILVETTRIQLAILRVVGEALGSRPRGTNFADRSLSSSSNPESDNGSCPSTADDDTLAVSSFL